MSVLATKQCGAGEESTSFSMILESLKFHGLLGNNPEVLFDLRKASSECIDKYFGHISNFFYWGSFRSTKPYAIFQISSRVTNRVMKR